MAVSHTRKGPGWWMDRDGGWNPPELWPESTPPLPGWIRQSNGRWEAPLEVDTSTTEDAPVIDLTEPDGPVSAPLHASLPLEESDDDQPLPESLHIPLHAARPGDVPHDVEPESKPSLSLGFAPPPVSEEPPPVLEEPAAPPRRWGRVVVGIAVVIALLVVVLLVL